jgi:hypothetical protein
MPIKVQTDRSRAVKIHVRVVDSGEYRLNKT